MTPGSPATHWSPGIWLRGVCAGPSGGDDLLLGKWLLCWASLHTAYPVLHDPQMYHRCTGIKPAQGVADFDCATGDHRNQWWNLLHHPLLRREGFLLAYCEPESEA